MHRVWAEIDLDAVEENYHEICSRTGGAVYAVVKANAYGHGAVQVAKRLWAAGCTRFAVATGQEALALRKHHVAGEILLLGGVENGEIARLVQEDISLTVADGEMARQYLQVLQQENLRARVQIKVDSGMGRLGFACHPDSAAEILSLARNPHLKIDGVFTHFPCADDRNFDQLTKLQYDAFCDLTDQLKKGGLSDVLYHCDNSAALLDYPKGAQNAIRTGILLYGVNPCIQNTMRFHPVMSLHTRIVQIKKVKKGTSVSYGHIWTAPRDCTIAVVSIGYADGLSRVASGRFSMLLRGELVQQVGRICMDMCMLDISAVSDAAVGDVVTIFGENGGQTLPVTAFSQAAQTIPYEIFCSIAPRVMRCYLEHGQVVEQVCYIDQI